MNVRDPRHQVTRNWAHTRVVRLRVASRTANFWQVPRPANTKNNQQHFNNNQNIFINNKKRSKEHIGVRHGATSGMLRAWSRARLRGMARLALTTRNRKLYKSDPFLEEFVQSPEKTIREGIWKCFQKPGTYVRVRSGTRESQHCELQPPAQTVEREGERGGEVLEGRPGLCLASSLIIITCLFGSGLWRELERDRLLGEWGGDLLLGDLDPVLLDILAVRDLMPLGMAGRRDPNLRSIHFSIASTASVEGRRWVAAERKFCDLVILKVTAMPCNARMASSSVLSSPAKIVDTRSHQSNPKRVLKI
ncbi:hypothetical protein E2C01_049824 [Portunus trituberculatus]|uniref:Uncharacterized protein n=1 Tax=Portunus trituberculatus TaxID=210409 RepID=A0A5B7GEA2_PORTR|nr:hypothetical protein [Portunus trituberculatus]